MGTAASGEAAGCGWHLAAAATRLRLALGAWRCTSQFLALACQQQLGLGGPLSSVLLAAGRRRAAGRLAGTPRLP